MNTFQGVSFALPVKSAETQPSEDARNKDDDCKPLGHFREYLTEIFGILAAQEEKQREHRKRSCVDRTKQQQNFHVKSSAGARESCAVRVARSTRFAGVQFFRLDLNLNLGGRVTCKAPSNSLLELPAA